MTRLATILCLAALAGCGGTDSFRQAYDAREELVRSQQQLCDSQQEALDSFKGRIESYERRWKAHSAEPVVTKEQLAGIYRRLVELEKRAGIRDAEGNKISGATAP